MTEYITTKKQCQEQIDKRQKVCTRCGGVSYPIKTVDNSNNPTYWTGCDRCRVFDYGTTKHIYDIAVKMVDERNFTAYNYEQKPDKKKDRKLFNYWRGGQISGTVSIVQDILNFDKI